MHNAQRCSACKCPFHSKIWHLNAHQGVPRAVPELLRTYEFPRDVDIPKTAENVKRHCLICQSCQAPTWALDGPLVMTPIPPRFMASVSIDLFQMPLVTHHGQNFDAYLLWVDRHPGWMVARPTQYDGLSGQKAAHLFVDGSWGEMGVPSIITCDLGAQFISDWWKTMCTRLGVRMAFSQAYRHQTNGRAEVAGRVINDLLRKMFHENSINWVEALPRILRVQHDSTDPITGLSPYQIVFGWVRALAPLPFWYSDDCPDAVQFFDHMDKIDAVVAEKLNLAHHTTQQTINAHRHLKKPFQIGDVVWNLKPKPIGGVKLATWWEGPCRIVAKTGASSYQLRFRDGRIIDDHITKLKKKCLGTPR